MLNTSDYQDYWGRVVNALACIYLYLHVRNDGFQYRIRYHTFPEAVSRARVAYYYCDPLPRFTFGMHGDEVDDFFSDLVINSDRLDAICSDALDNYCSGAPIVPMRLL